MRILYTLLYRTLSKLPWWLIDSLAWVLTLLIYYIIRYRRQVVEDNLSACFPEKGTQEREAIAKDFYHHLVYQLLSSPKLLYTPQDKLRRAYLQLYGMDLLQEETERSGRKLFIALLGHVGNWELMSAGNLYLQDYGIRLEQLYKPLTNKALDAVQKEMRSHNGSITTPKDEAGRRMLKLYRDPKAEPTVMAFIADQTPHAHKVGLWADFLGRETAFLDGAERLARKLNLPVYYFDVERISNRHYTGRFTLVCLEPKDTEEGEVTRAYIKLLEKSIRRDPAIWLWSHKRWKFTRPQQEEGASEVNG